MWSLRVNETFSPVFFFLDSFCSRLYDCTFSPLAYGPIPAHKSPPGGNLPKRQGQHWYLPQCRTRLVSCSTSSSMTFGMIIIIFLLIHKNLNHMAWLSSYADADTWSHPATIMVWFSVKWGLFCPNKWFAYPVKSSSNDNSHYQIITLLERWWAWSHKIVHKWNVTLSIGKTHISTL